MSTERARFGNKPKSWCDEVQVPVGSWYHVAGRECLESGLRLLLCPYPKNIAGKKGGAKFPLCFVVSEPKKYSRKHVARF